MIVGTPDKATIATQTQDMVDTTNHRVISFTFSSTKGITAPSVLAVTAIDIDSDSSIKIANNCFLPGEMSESNSESADRHNEVERNVHRKKKRRDKTTPEITTTAATITGKTANGRKR